MRKKLGLEIFLMLFFALMVIGGVWLYYALRSPAQEGVIIEVKPGEKLIEVAKELEKKGVISDHRLLVGLAKLKGVEKKIQVGEYEFSPGMSINQILDALVKGRQRYYKLVVPEGSNLWDIARILEKTGIWDGNKFLDLAFDPKFIRSLGLKTKSLEGYLYPDTYFFKRYETEEDIIRAMHKHFQEIWKPQYTRRAKKLGFSQHQIITIASIIEKETSQKPEKPLVSAVIHNRLKKGMRLELDPTVIYGLLPNFDGNLRKKDLEHWTPYNTYLNSGLPPGPICNPGKDAIESALYPAEVDYLYFVSKGDGTHYFSSTYAEHKKAVEKYQLRRR